MILIQSYLNHAQSSLHFISAKFLFPWLSNLQQQLRCDLRIPYSFL